MADKKVSELTTLNTASGDDLLLVVNDPSGTPASRKITVNNLFGNVVVSTTHKAPTTFQANTFIRGTVCTVSANVNITAGLSVNTVAILPAVQDRMQVANVNALFVNSSLTGNVVLGKATANSVFVQETEGLRVAGGGVVDAVPATSNATTEGIAAGTIWYSNNHLYIAVDANTIKRADLSTF